VSSCHGHSCCGVTTAEQRSWLPRSPCSSVGEIEHYPACLDPTTATPQGITRVEHAPQVGAHVST
jgi:hypothetical protein